MGDCNPICCPKEIDSCCCAYGIWPTPEHPSQTCISGIVGCITCGIIFTHYPPAEPPRQVYQVPALKREFMVPPNFVPTEMNPQPIYIEVISVQIPPTIPQRSYLSVPKSNGDALVFEIPIGTCPGSIIQVQG